MKLFLLHICLQGGVKHQSWYLDSGCSRHVTREKYMFQTLNLKEGGDVRFRGSQKGKIIGIDTIGNSSTSIYNV